MKTLILFFFLALASCSKDNNTVDDQLPPITQTGANTAGCIINGKVLIPKNTINSLSGYPVYGLNYYVGPQFGIPLFNDYFSLKIANLRSTGIDYWIYIHLNEMNLGVGTYIVEQSNAEFYVDGPNNPQVIVRETTNGKSGRTFLSGVNSGYIIITRFDYSNKIITGTFKCTLYNEVNPSETINVTDGRFDINLATLNSK